jgi:hypothetical protein
VRPYGRVSRANAHGAKLLRGARLADVADDHDEFDLAGAQVDNARRALGGEVRSGEDAGGGGAVLHGSVTIAEHESGCKRNRQAVLALRDEVKIARLKRAISDHDHRRLLAPCDNALAAVNDRLPTARGHVVARAPGAARVDREHAKLLALALNRQGDDLVADHGRQVRGQGSRGDDVVSGVHGSVSIAERKPTCKRNRQAFIAHKEPDRAAILGT